MAKVFRTFPDGRIVSGDRVVIAGDHAHYERDFEWSDKSGNKRRVRGVDIFKFDGDKLKYKSAYLKQFVAAA